jgi:hypothetical protein
MKTIVTHIGPDLDAITSIWLIKTFFPDWEEAILAFVPAGLTLQGMVPDSDPEIWHVDTGLGKYDHHQDNRDTCAAKLVYEDIVKRGKGSDALDRMLHVINDIDHFRQVHFPNPDADYWYFGLEIQIDGWRLMYNDNWMKVVDLGFQSLDAIFKMFQNKVWAERELKNKGVIKESKWGKVIGVETVNDEAVTIAQRMGYAIAVRKDPNKGYVRIKASPSETIDLTPVYERLKAKDPTATWYLHPSYHMILNGSSKNPSMRPSTLTLLEILEEVIHE